MSESPRTQDERITSVWLATGALTIASAIAAARFGHGQAGRVGLSLAVLAIGAAKAALILARLHGAPDRAPMAPLVRRHLAVGPVRDDRGAVPAVTPAQGVDALRIAGSSSR